MNCPKCNQETDILIVQGVDRMCRECEIKEISRILCEITDQIGYNEFVEKVLQSEDRTASPTLGYQQIGIKKKKSET